MEKVILIGHIRPDLDCLLSKEIIKNHYNVVEEIEVPVRIDLAGLQKMKKSGYLTIAVDVGQVEGLHQEEGLMVFDHHGSRKFKSAVEVLSRDYNVPKQAVEAADNPKFIEFGNFAASCLYHYIISGKDLFKLAEEGHLDKIPEWILEKYPEIVEEKAKREAQYLSMMEHIKECPNVGDIVISDKFFMGGFLAAYKVGYRVYVAITPHKERGFTFAVSAKDNSLFQYKELLEKEFPGVFVHPAGFIAIYGGPKNPSVYIDGKFEDIKENILKIIG